MQAREPCASGSCYLPNPDDFQERRICGVHSPRARKAAETTILEGLEARRQRMRGVTARGARAGLRRRRVAQVQDGGRAVARRRGGGVL